MYIDALWASPHTSCMYSTSHVLCTSPHILLLRNSPCMCCNVLFCRLSKCCLSDQYIVLSSISVVNSILSSDCLFVQYLQLHTCTRLHTINSYCEIDIFSPPLSSCYRWPSRLFQSPKCSRGPRFVSNRHYSQY